MKEPTPTSYAVLGLPAARPQTAYELARQVTRGLRFVWPRAEGRIYDEPKLLADHGLAAARQEYTGRRPRTVYSITRKAGGTSALDRRARSRTDPEYETLLKVAFAAAAPKQTWSATCPPSAGTPQPTWPPAAPGPMSTLMSSYPFPSTSPSTA